MCKTNNCRTAVNALAKKKKKQTYWCGYVAEIT